ncbi:hypothetical protein AAVH_14520 [Aphelenchoides avenae]|nr:hypothetical protein AAVH_14520 [Aphelenchus avenae]
MYSGFVDYNGLRLSAFSESRLYRLQQKVTRQYGLAKEEYKAAQGQLLLSASAQGASSVKALGERVKGLRILMDAIEAKVFLEATDIPATGGLDAARAKAKLNEAVRQLRWAEDFGLSEDDADYGPELERRRRKVEEAQRLYDSACATATYDAILRRQVQAARAVVSSTERLTDMVADGADDEPALAAVVAACKAAMKHWRKREDAAIEASRFLEDSYEASSRNSTMASSFEVVGRPASASTTTSASFLQMAPSGSRQYEPELSGSRSVVSSRSSLAATARASSSAQGSVSRAEATPAVAAASTSGLANFFEFTPPVASTPLPGLNVRIGTDRRRASAARGFEFGERTAAATGRRPTTSPALGSGNQAQARRTAKKKRGEYPNRTLWVGRLRPEVDAARLRQFIQQLGYDRIETVRTGFGDSTYGDGKTHYYGWVTFADLDKAEECRFRWDSVSDWALTPMDERRGVRRLLHFTFCNNTKYAPDLAGDHGSGSDED